MTTTKEITINDEKYYDALSILEDYYNGKEVDMKDVTKAKGIVNHAEFLSELERQNSYCKPHYPDAPEGSIWDY